MRVRCRRDMVLVRPKAAWTKPPELAASRSGASPGPHIAARIALQLVVQPEGRASRDAEIVTRSTKPFVGATFFLTLAQPKGVRRVLPTECSLNRRNASVATCDTSPGLWRVQGRHEASARCRFPSRTSPSLNPTARPNVITGAKRSLWKDCQALISARREVAEAREVKSSKDTRTSLGRDQLR
jgi:hypothetical protein